MKARPKKRNFASRKQARFLFLKHPEIAKRWVNRSKRKGIKHPIKPLPQYSNTPSARASRKKKK